MTVLSVPTSDADDPVGDLAQLVLAMTPEQLEAFASTLDPDDMAALEQVMAQRAAMGWRTDPATMANHLTNGEYELWPYVRLLSSQFVKAIRGEDPRQLWNMPSQHGKTSALMWGVIWALDFNPKLRIMYVTYDADKAKKDAGDALDKVRQHGDELRLHLRQDVQSRGRWMTEEGGWLYATGVQGSITGWPADVVLGDDLIKGWREAHSEATRSMTWNVYLSQMRFRLQKPTDPVILAGTRWHESDPTGKALTSSPDVKPWTLIRLPAVAEEPDTTSPIPQMRQPDPLGRQPGEMLGRFPPEEVEARGRVGAYLRASLEQQRPAPEEGSELLRAWWKWEVTLPPRFTTQISSWDLKLKDKEAGDYVVGQCWGQTGSDYWLIEQLAGQWNQATTKLAIALMAIRHPGIERHYVENTGNAPEVMAELRKPNTDYEVSEAMASDLGMTDDERAQVQRLIRRGLNRLIPVNPKGDKRVRARAVSGILEGGGCHLLENDPAALALVNQAASFPNSGHDDMVDAWSQAMSKLSGGGGRLAVPSGTITKPPINTRAQAMPQRSRVMLPGPRPR